MELEELFLEYEDKLDKAYDNLVGNYATVRADRANPHILDKVFVDYYGTRAPLNQTSNITVADARTIIISPWDVSMVKKISGAIAEANLGLSVGDDGKIVRLSFPELTEERRKEFGKDVRRMLEDCLIAMRNARRDAMDGLKSMKNNGLSEDEVERQSKEVQKMIDNMTEKAQTLCEKKISEIMEI